MYIQAKDRRELSQTKAKPFLVIFRFRDDFLNLPDSFTGRLWQESCSVLILREGKGCYGYAHFVTETVAECVITF